MGCSGALIAFCKTTEVIFADVWPDNWLNNPSSMRLFLFRRDAIQAQLPMALDSDLFIKNLN
jgi:hypothetical protein